MRASNTVRARNHAARRALAKAIHAAQPDIDGLIYESRLTDGATYAVFDRGVTKIEATATGPLGDHPDLPDVLEWHGIQLAR